MPLQKVYSRDEEKPPQEPLDPPPRRRGRRLRALRLGQPLGRAGGRAPGPARGAQGPAGLRRPGRRLELRPLEARPDGARLRLLPRGPGRPGHVRRDLRELPALEPPAPGHRLPGAALYEAPADRDDHARWEESALLSARVPALGSAR